MSVRVTACGCALLLVGCANFKGITPVVRELTPAQLDAGATEVQWPRDDWWKQFNDPVLDAFIERALAGNPQLDAARARLAQAQAAIAATGAARGPRVDLQAESTRQRFNENYVYPPPIAGRIDSINSLDRPVMVAYLMLVAFFFIVINLLIDIAYVALDPRLRLRRAS